MNIILSSTVVSAIIAGVLSFLVTRKQDSLQYITAERSKWRAEIRECVDKIQNAKEYDFIKSINTLKTRLNPFGKVCVGYKFEHDSHIWELMEEIQDKRNQGDILRIRKELLIDYLALLLKRDWEKTKAEVTIGWYKVICGLCLIASYGIYTYTVYTYSSQDKALSKGDVFFMCALLTLFLIIPYFFATRLGADAAGSTSNFYCDHQKKCTTGMKYCRGAGISFVLVYMIAIWSILWITISMLKIDVENNLEIFGIQTLFIFLNGIVMCLKYKEQIDKATNDKKYYDCILKCKVDAMEKIIQCIYQDNKEENGLEYCKKYFHDNLKADEEEAIRGIWNNLAKTDA